MTPWQIKGLRLEESALKHLDGFIAEHGLMIAIGIIYMLVVLCIWVLAGGLRRWFNEPPCGVRPVIIIQSPAPPPPAPESFDPFPPLRECDCGHDHDEWED